ncbi:MAG: hypothetical protein A3G87_06555 [Omnitrophica bacterium RIFCSPLOWO2_12_FULL_50_11]|nr:MAG: hypothetical protein A3G87_06555 [Omnitrophica bacterium RIFCSPLOWO2_12_FULL_50_11]
MAKKKWYRFYLYLLLGAVQQFFLIVPRSAGHALAACMGTCAWWMLPSQRVSTLRHLDQAFGSEISAAERYKIGCGVFVHLSKTAVDVCRFPKLTRQRIVDLVRLDEGTGKLDEALSRGQGVIALTGHLGNWELLASYFRFLGYQGRLVGRRIYFDCYDHFVISLRENALVRTIYRDEAVRLVLEQLKKNHMVGMSADQDIDSLEGIFVPFFGRESWTPVAPAKIALASGAAIVPMYMIREGRRYRLFIKDPIWPNRSRPRDVAVREMTEAWSRVVEQMIRRYPDQWVWNHDRWKTKPAGRNEAAENVKEEKVYPAPQKASSVKTAMIPYPLISCERDGGG